MKYSIALYISLLSICSVSTGLCYAVDLLEEMIVTGQVDAGISHRWNHQEIEQAGIKKTSDVAQFIPNFAIDHAGADDAIITVRGISHLNDKTNSPVAIDIDGLPLADQLQLKQELHNIEKIDVTKGPQILSAQRAPAGKIHIVTRKPDNKSKAYMQVGGGSGGQESISGFYGGPLKKDRLFFSLTASHQQQDGRITNRFLNKKVDFSESESLYTHLLWQVSKALTTNLKLAYGDVSSGAQYYSFIPDSEDANTFLSPSANQLGEKQQEDINATLKTQWESTLGNFSFISAYTHLDKSHTADIEFSSRADLEAIQDKALNLELISQEFTFTSPTNNSLRWSLGSYIQQSRKKIDDALGEISSQIEDNNNINSLFGQLEYTFKKRYEASLGLRYDRNSRETSLNGAMRKKTFSAWQPKITLAKYWSDQNSLYISYGTAFRPGGFNVDSLASFDSEFLDNYELGIKSHWLDSRLIINLSVFYAQSENYQIFEREIEQGFLIFIPIIINETPTVNNIDRVDIWGSEIEIKGNLTKNWLLSLSLGSADTEIKDYKDSPLTPADETTFIGNQTPRNTEYTLNFYTQYTLQFSKQIKSLFRLEYEHYGPKYWSASNLYSMDPYSLLNARVITYYGDSFSLSFWGKNLTDEQYWTDFIPAEASSSNLETVDFNAGLLGHPRSLGMALKLLL